jgi:flagellar protein FlaG
MEVSTSQFGQEFAIPRNEVAPEKVDTSLANNKVLEASEQSAKGIPLAADTVTQDSNFAAQSIETAVSQISDFVQASNRQLNFSIDEGSSKQVVQVTDAASGDLIRQIPSEEVLKLSERLQDLQTEVGTAVGLLFNKQV